MIVAIAGPLSNLLQAIVFAILIRINVYHPFFNLTDNAGLFMTMGVTLNLVLMMFNMIPIAPLDGSKVLAGLLPAKLADEYELFMRQFGFMLLIVVWRFGASLIWPEVELFSHFLMGW